MSTSTHGATDLGRRIREQRHRAGLTRQQAAACAGMSGTYLAYLETDRDAAPTAAALVRLAAALGTTRAALAGAGVDLPPGQQRPAPHPGLEVLTEADCHDYLGRGGVGRFVFTNTRGPVALPVNYRVLDGDIVFRTSAWGSLTERALQRRVSFEVDHIDDAFGEGWSVLVSGRAHLVTDPAERERVRSLGIAPWAGGARETYIRLTAVQVTGRRIRAR